MIVYKSSETAEQEAVVEYCDLMHIPVVHIPNEGKRSAAYGAMLKRAGLRTGFPDLFIPRARKGYHGLFIEMKYGNNKPTQNQLDWLQSLTAEGYICRICYGADAAIAIINKYIGECKAK